MIQYQKKGRMSKIKFLGKSLTTLRTTGAVVPSSRFLCQEMVEIIDYSKAKILIELGAGNGVITKHLLSRMAPDTQLIVFEVQPAFCEILRAIDDDRLIIIEDSAEHLHQYLEKYGFEKADWHCFCYPFCDST